MITLREVLCATDIDQPARTALSLSFFIAERFKASLSVVHATQSACKSNLYVPAQKRFEQLACAQRLRERLDALVRAIPRERAEEHAKTHVVDGKLVEAVVACSERERSNLIVLGTKPHLRAAWSGGEGPAERIGDIAWCPVLTVPHEGRLSAHRVQRILLTIFLPTRENADAIAWAVLLAARFGAIVELLSAGNETLDQEAEGALREAGVGFEPRTRPPGSTLADSIVNRLEQGDCDLVVMSTQRQSRSHFSILANVRQRSLVPVLAVRAKDSERRFVDEPAEEDAHADERRAANASARHPLPRETAQGTKNLSG